MHQIVAFSSTIEHNQKLAEVTDDEEEQSVPENKSIQSEGDDSKFFQVMDESQNGT